MTVRRALSAALVAGLALLVVALALGGAPARAAAADGPASYSDYRGRIATAITILDDAMPRITDQDVAQRAAADITVLLPPTERVDTGSGLVVVDNSTLRTYTLQLDVAVKGTTRTDLANEIRAYLASLEAANPAGSGTLRSDPAALKALLAEGVSPARKTLGDYLSEWIARLTDAISKWLVANLGRQGASFATTAATVIAVVVLAALVLFLLLRAMARGRRAVARRDKAAPHLTSPVVAAAEGLPDDIVGHADSLAGQGLFREAVRALFGGAARELVDRGLLRRTRTRTDAELLDDVAPVAPGVHPPLRDLTSDFEVAWYGHVDPGEDGFRTARGRYGEVIAATKAAEAAPVAPAPAAPASTPVPPAPAAPRGPEAGDAR